MRFKNKAQRQAIMAAMRARDSGFRFRTRKNINIGKNTTTKEFQALMLSTEAGIMSIEGQYSVGILSDVKVPPKGNIMFKSYNGETLRVSDAEGSVFRYDGDPKLGGRILFSERIWDDKWKREFKADPEAINIQAVQLRKRII
jgi:hypothetical protein